MGTALRTIVATAKAQKESISGKGKLTEMKIKKMQNYYGRAIKDYLSDSGVLQKRIMAISTFPLLIKLQSMHIMVLLAEISLKTFGSRVPYRA